MRKGQYVGPREPRPVADQLAQKIFLKTCETCGYHVPKEQEVEAGRMIPCSPYHVRCVRCTWPVAKTLVSLEGLCYSCMSGNARREYNRKSGRRLYGEADGSTDPADYLMNGRMTIHGDEADLLEQRRADSHVITRAVQRARAAAYPERIPRTPPITLRPPRDGDRYQKGQCQYPKCPEKAVNKDYCSSRCRMTHRWEHFKAMQDATKEPPDADIPESPDRPHCPEPVPERSYG